MGIIAQRNRNEHYHLVLGRMPDRRRKVLQAISDAGDEGLTRYELAKKLNLPVTSVTDPVQKLEQEWYVLTSKDRRPTENGGMATVVKLSTQFIDGKEPLKQLEMEFK